MSRIRAISLASLALIVTVSIAAAQLAPEQDALARACSAISIDQCYRDGLNRIIQKQFLPKISPVLTASQQSMLNTVRFSVIEDPNPLGAYSGITNGVPVTTITSGVGYHLALFGNAAALNVLLGKQLTLYQDYQQKVVSVLIENTSRASLGQSLLPTPGFAQSENIDSQQVATLMNSDTTLGMSAYFTLMMNFWALAHETGHQVLGHTKALAANPAAPRKPMEIAADDFASRSLVKMGYSVYPTIFLMEYFGALEQAGAGSPADYPPAICRLANVFTSAWAQRALGAPVSDAINQQWNEVMDQAALKASISNVLAEPQCRS